MKRRLRNTTTWRTESQKKSSQSASSLLKLAAADWLESHCANYWHETKTKKYHDLTNRIAEKEFAVRFFAFEVGCRGLVGKSLRTFLAALPLPKKIIEKTLTDCANSSLH
jgi:hypothetical protein